MTLRESQWRSSMWKPFFKCVAKKTRFCSCVAKILFACLLFIRVILILWGSNNNYFNSLFNHFIGWLVTVFEELFCPNYNQSFVLPVKKQIHVSCKISSKIVVSAFKVKLLSFEEQIHTYLFSKNYMYLIIFCWIRNLHKELYKFIQNFRLTFLRLRWNFPMKFKMSFLITLLYFLIF